MRAMREGIARETTRSQVESLFQTGLRRLQAAARLKSPADVAQLVEHFTRNEGVPGSSPGVGSKKRPC
jgi:hypothetical protein